jgi:hypothetical protein
LNGSGWIITKAARDRAESFAIAMTSHLLM